MKKTLFLSALALALPSLLLAQTAAPAPDFAQASSEAQQRLDAALRDLNEVQAQINAEKPRLAAQLDLLEQEVTRLRRENQQAVTTRNTSSSDIVALDRDIAGLREANAYIQSTLMAEYFRRVQSSLSPAERSLYETQISDVLNMLEAEVRPSDADLFRAELDLLRITMERASNSIGGKINEGQANVDGTVVPGRFVIVGPSAFFAGEGDAAGIVFGEVGGYANIFPLPQYAADIAAATQGQGVLPLDTTGGEAIRFTDLDLTLVQEYFKGGFVMHFILALSIAAVIVALYKTVQLFTVKAVKERDLDTVLELLSKGDRAGALAHAQKVGGPGGSLLVAGVENADQDKEVIEEVLYERIINTQPSLDRGLPFIAVAAATAPLLGLLGTVTGMINTFKLITVVGTGDPGALSSGISEALITTKWGLLVAIPTLIVHALLTRKARGVIGSMEQSAVGFINGITEIRARDNRAA